jgi:hypothetical protein
MEQPQFLQDEIASERSGSASNTPAEPSDVSACLRD